MTRVIDYYVLLLDVHGPYFHDQVRRESEDMRELEQHYVERGGVEFERYVSDDGTYQEFRADYVVARELTIVYVESDGDPITRSISSPLGSLDRDRDDAVLQTTSTEER